MFKKPEYWILFAAALSLGLSITIYASGNTDLGQFIGLWVPSILAAGIYLKVLK